MQGPKQDLAPVGSEAVPVAGRGSQPREGPAPRARAPASQLAARGLPARIGGPAVAQRPRAPPPWSSREEQAGTPA